MPRIRTIKPEFFDSPDTARASHAARLLFIAMWCWADDYGVGAANMKALAGFAFPNDDAITSKELPCICKEVADTFGVVFYEAQGRPFYAIPSWDLHQRTERKSQRQNPAPPDDVSPGQRWFGGTTDDLQGSSLQTQGSVVAGTGEQGNRGTGENPSCASGDAPDGSDRFEEFWDTYAKKRDRKRAEAKWRVALKKPGVTADVLIAAASRYVTEQRRNGKHPEYTKDPHTWLNGENWRDELDAAHNGQPRELPPPPPRSWMHTHLPEDQW